MRTYKLLIEQCLSAVSLRYSCLKGICHKRQQLPPAAHHIGGWNLFTVFGDPSPAVILAKQNPPPTVNTNLDLIPVTVVEKTSQYIHWRALMVTVLHRVKDPARQMVVLFIFVAQAKWIDSLCLEISLLGHL